MNSYGNSFLCFGYNFSFFFVLIVDEDCSKMIIFFILDCNSFKVKGRKRVTKLCASVVQRAPGRTSSLFFLFFVVRHAR